MGQLFNGLSSLERDALKDYATEKYFAEPKATRGEVNDWVGKYTENLVKTDLSPGCRNYPCLCEGKKQTLPYQVGGINAGSTSEAILAA